MTFSLSLNSPLVASTLQTFYQRALPHAIGVFKHGFTADYLAVTEITATKQKSLLVGEEALNCASETLRGN
jgi:hypothetical protein